MDFQALAAQFNVDAFALKSLMTWLQLQIEKNEQFRSLFLNEATRDEAMRLGVMEWNRRGTEFYTELMENKTERAREYREQIEHEIWTAARAA